jgi:hypothetical protein
MASKYSAPWRTRSRARRKLLRRLLLFVFLAVFWIWVIAEMGHLLELNRVDHTLTKCHHISMTPDRLLFYQI